jgi:hypothetical protein
MHIRSEHLDQIYDLVFRVHGLCVFSKEHLEIM